MSDFDEWRTIVKVINQHGELLSLVMGGNPDQALRAARLVVQAQEWRGEEEQ